MPNQKKFRPILPNADASPSPPPSHSLSSDVRRKREAVPAACLGCRKKKVKCNGQRPTCGTCASAKIACEWPVPEGLSTRQAEARRIEELAKKNEDLRTAFEMLRNSKDRESLDILQKIKAADSVDNAISMLLDASLLLPARGAGRSAKFPLRSHMSDSADPATPGSNEELAARAGRSSPASERLYARFPEGLKSFEDETERFREVVLPLSRWTSASKDDEHLTHLLTLFWTWDNSVGRIIDRSLFLEDLLSEEPGEDGWVEPRFCSPFLVNSLLAASCIYSSQDKACAIPGDLTTRGRHFRDEAFRLLEEERSRPSITLLQGLGMLRFYEVSIGDGALAERMSRHLLDVYESLTWEAARPPAQKSVLQTRLDRVLQAKSHISWGMYCVNAKNDVIFQQPLTIRKPATPKTFEDGSSSFLSSRDTPGYLWRAYPVSEQDYPGYPREAFVAECALTELIEEAMDICGRNNRGKRNPVNREACKVLYDQLLEWKETLPDYLQDNESILPYVHVLHATFDVTVVELLSAVATSQPGPEFGSPSPNSLCFAHVTALLSKVWAFRALYNLHHEPGLSFACFMLAKSVLAGPGTSPVNLDIFVKACQGLFEMGEHLHLANTYLRGIRQMAEVADADVPTRTAKYFEGLEDRGQSTYVDLAHWMFQISPVSPMSEDTGDFPN